MVEVSHAANVMGLVAKIRLLSPLQQVNSNRERPPHLIMRAMVFRRVMAQLTFVC
jgi:hypothetical protein